MLELIADKKRPPEATKFLQDLGLVNPPEDKKTPEPILVKIAPEPKDEVPPKG